MNLSKISLNRLEGIEPVLIDILLDGIKTSPYDFGIPKFGGLRTEEDQIKMYAIGRTTELHRSPVTWTLNSYHKTGKAFDLFAYVDGKASWDLKYLGPIAKHLQKVAMDLYCVELQWGQELWGKDGAHFQIN
tara:strand:- start:1478 stop:1873 length:396 start_codon:yes stop_codon:yes gene_type:complete